MPVGREINGGERASEVSRRVYLWKRGIRAVAQSEEINFLNKEAPHTITRISRNVNT